MKIEGLVTLRGSLIPLYSVKLKNLTWDMSGRIL